MPKISSLTNEQRLTLDKFRQRMFDAAISTVTDKLAAESAISVIVAPAMNKYEVHWVTDPQAAASLWNSLRDSLRDSIGASLGASLWDSLWASLGASLRDSIRTSLWDSLKDSLWDSLWETNWTASYLFPIEIGIVEVEADKSELIKAFAEFGQHAFALWVLPGHIIALEKPKSVKVKDEKLVGISWDE
jgi:hypothetical protein